MSQPAVEFGIKFRRCGGSTAILSKTPQNQRQRYHLVGRDPGRLGRCAQMLEHPLLSRACMSDRRIQMVSQRPCIQPAVLDPIQLFSQIQRKTHDILSNSFSGRVSNQHQPQRWSVVGMFLSISNLAPQNYSCLSSRWTWEQYEHQHREIEQMPIRPGLEVLDCRCVDG